MSVIIAERPQSVEFFLPGGIPEAQLHMRVVDVDVCAKISHPPCGQTGCATDHGRSSLRAIGQHCLRMGIRGSLSPKTVGSLLSAQVSARSPHSGYPLYLLYRGEVTAVAYTSAQDLSREGPAGREKDVFTRTAGQTYPRVKTFSSDVLPQAPSPL